MSNTTTRLCNESIQCQEQVSQAAYVENFNSLMEDHTVIEGLEHEFSVALFQQNKRVIERVLPEISTRITHMESTVEKISTILAMWTSSVRDKNSKIVAEVLKQDRVLLASLQERRFFSIEKSCNELVQEIISFVRHHPINHILFRSFERLESEASLLPADRGARLVSEARISVATVCAEEGIENIEQYFHFFRIQNDALRFFLLKRCLQHSGHARHVAEYIGNFEIKNEEDRFYIARECLEKSPHEFVRALASFDLTREHRAALAKLCVEVLPAAFVESVRAFGIEDEELRKELAERCLVKDACLLASHIQDFDLSREETRLDLAKKCAKLNMRTIPLYFANFSIQNEEFRSELFEYCITLGAERMVRQLKELS